MDWVGILGYIIAPISAIVSWIAGRKKSDNDFLQDMQETINMLVDKNSELVAEVVKLRTDNALLLANQEALKKQIEELTQKNDELMQLYELRVENGKRKGESGKRKVEN